VSVTRVSRVALAVLALAGVAEAQDADAQRARELFERGVQLMQNEDWSAALVQLEESFRLRPTQVALFNMGLCHKGLRRYGAAIRAFERMIVELGDRAPGNRVELARAEIQALRALFGTVTVEVQPAGARIFVDGEPAGTAPLAEPLELSAGNHVIRATGEGLTADTVTIAVIAGASTTVRLAPPALPPAPPEHPNPPPPPPHVQTRIPPTPPPPIVRDERHGLAPMWFWSSAGLAGAGAVVTAILGGLVVSGDADYRESRVRLESEREDGRRLALFTDVALGVTLLAAVGAVLLYGPTDFGGAQSEARF
jgi:hypothetical protein